MKIDISHPKAPWYEVIDLDTGEYIPYCIAANDETGYYTVYVVDEKGQFIHEEIHPEDMPYLKRESKKGILKYKKQEGQND